MNITSTQSAKAAAQFLERLNRQRTDWDYGEIKFFEQSYAGGKGYINKENLFNHRREKAEDFQRRLQRAYYYNFMAPIVDSFGFFLFKQDPVRTIEKDIENNAIDSFIKNADGRGQSLSNFLRTAVIQGLTTGHCFIAIDSPDSPASTVADAISNDKRPFVYTIRHSDVLDYSIDPFGNFKWFKFRESLDSKDSWDYSEASKEVITVWTPANWTQYDRKTGQLYKQGENKINAVPIVDLRSLSDGSSLIRDMVYINRAIFNWCSLLDELLYRQTFSILVLPRDEDETLTDKRVSTAEAFTYDPESKQPPQYISPDSGQAATLSGEIEKAIARLYQLANLDWAAGEEGIKSALARSYDFLNTSKTLGAMAASTEEAENKIFDFFIKYYTAASDSSSEDYVHTIYPREFSAIALLENVNDMFTALTYSISKRFNILLKRQIVRTFMPRLSDKDQEEIDEEIEEAEETATEQFPPEPGGQPQFGAGPESQAQSSLNGQEANMGQ